MRVGNPIGLRAWVAIVRGTIDEAELDASRGVSDGGASEPLKAHVE